ncbi:hypothetical protein BO71DRAFT_418361 [Aspergillus ellipticus CBS 707.79]|uniref:Uncharacterized protein n=1 Tax=Aspergillus ellipticus CBS 707.79 TaxID=1448320 RepID=A0A319DEF5_9EURO|nr:hypothetical protein BO71DRAFT_418361 [Aspergillus ellipticus CBS 707.79]
MPKYRPIPAPLGRALIECFRATTRLARPDMRHQLVLVGGAASIAHSSVYYTEDVDVVAPCNVLTDIWKVLTAGAPNFTIEPDGKDIVDRIYVTEPFFEGSVASMSDLLRFRAMTVVDCGSGGESADFRWLLSEVARVGQVLPGLDSEELEYMSTAGRSCLGRFDRLVLAAILSESDAKVVFADLLSLV